VRVWKRWQAAARDLAREVCALALACRDPRVPVYAKLIAGGVVAYALSPIDLIPDFIPIVGHLDDLVLLPLGILVVRRLIPKSVMAECRARAEETLHDRSAGRWGAAMVVGLWILAAGAVLVIGRGLRPRG
jgi:uncharacterized membrane protein YkvA (DUF1232 family)